VQRVARFLSTGSAGDFLPVGWDFRGFQTQVRRWRLIVRLPKSTTSARDHDVSGMAPPQATHQRFPVAEMSKASFQRALQAGAKIAFSVNATGARGKQEGPYQGEEAVEFANMVEYGMTPLQALCSATSVAAENIGLGDRVGSIEKGKFADIIVVSGNPAVDITEMERVKFVMKGGQVYRNHSKNLTASANQK
jgi:imidazolonepropionase-like amidohydrolase